MERITLYLRTTKTSGKVRLRFRLTEGREVQLFHKSNIEADLADLKKFDMDGSLKPRVSLYNEDLRLAITREIDAMHEAYKQLKEECPEFDATDFEARIDMVLIPEKYNIVKTEETETLLARFDRYIDGLKTYDTVSEGRAKIYKIVWDKLSRYLIIFKKSRYTPEQFTPEDILAFREFVINEYKYVDKHKAIYGSLQKISIPTKQASINTASAKLRALQAFFNELEENDEILKSPFRRLTKKRRNEALREQYDEASGTMNRVPLHSVGSSKLCRKTHIDIANKAQVNMYASGLHEVGSSAVEHYSMLEIRDLFMLLCAAFNQPRYRVDKQLNVLQEEINGSE